MTQPNKNLSIFAIGTPLRESHIFQAHDAYVTVTGAQYIKLETVPTVFMVEHCIDADSENHRARVSRNPTRAEAVVRGRRRLGETIDHQNPGRRSLASLRLAAGLSQSQLAERIGMVQPNVARLERKPGDLPLSRLKLLAKALGVDLETVAAAVDICNDVEAEDV